MKSSKKLALVLILIIFIFPTSLVYSNTAPANNQELIRVLQEQVRILTMLLQQLLNSRQVNGTVTAPESRVLLNTCTDQLTSGIYSLSQNISASKPSCLKIVDTHDISLDCQGHIIQYSDNTIRVDKKNLYTNSNIDYSAPLIEINNSQNVQIKNCVLDTDGRIPLAIKSGRNITISGNQFLQSPYFSGNISVNSSDDVAFTDNKVNVYYEQSKTSNSKISDNAFLWQQPSKIAQTYINAVVQSSSGSNNLIDNNAINGSAIGNRNIQIGADHGVGLSNENLTTVSRNKISNNWFCGIETSGHIGNSKINANQISTIGYCGIGSFYLTDWSSNTVSNNGVKNSPMLFHFTRQNGLLPNEREVNFRDNRFIGNVFTGDGPENAAEFQFRLPFATQTSAERQPTASEVILSNNLFQDNNFNKNRPAPYFFPSSMVVDGRGNICGNYYGDAISTTNPIDCS